MRLFFVLFAVACTTGCVRVDPDHCANQENPGAYCLAQHEFVYCSACLSENNGCRVDQPKTECDAGESAADTSDATTTGTSMSATMSNTSVDPTTTTTETTVTMSTTESTDSSTGDPEPGCGNNVVEKSLGENCDGEDMPATSCMDVALPGGMLGCYPMGSQLECTYDLSECTGASQCGNGEIEGSEQCDEDNLARQTCEMLSDNYIGGTLTCVAPPADNMCTFNTSACEMCRENGDPCEVDGQCCSNNCFTLLGPGECAGLG